VHVSRRNNPDEGAVLPEGECDLEQAISGRLSQGVEARLSFAMPCVFSEDQGIVEEDTFGFGLTDAMFVRALAVIAAVPINPPDSIKEIGRAHV